MKQFQDYKEEINKEIPSIGGFSKDELYNIQEKYTEHSMMYREEDETLMNDYECGIKHFQD